MLVVVAALIALERYGRRRQGFAGCDARPATRTRASRSRARSDGWRSACCLVPVLLGFVVPVVYLAREVIAARAADRLRPGAGAPRAQHGAARGLRHRDRSCAIGFGAAFAVRLVRRRWPRPASSSPGSAMRCRARCWRSACCRRWSRSTKRSAAQRKALTGAQRRPGARRIERRGDHRLCDALPRDRDRLAQAGLARISTDLDDAARAVGARPSGLIRSIHLPLLRPALWGAALLVFVDCLKELPATLLLRPLNVETLSTYIYQFATRGNFEEGALAALLIVAVGIVPVIRMVRHADRPPARRVQARIRPARPDT